MILYAGALVLGLVGMGLLWYATERLWPEDEGRISEGTRRRL